MLHLELGIQIKRGGNFHIIATMPLKKKLFAHLYIPFFPNVLHVYSHRKLFSEKFLTFPLITSREGRRGQRGSINTFYFFVLNVLKSIDMIVTIGTNTRHFQFFFKY